MDYQGGGGGGGFAGGGSQGQSGGRARRSYDEQTVTPVTIRMALASRPDEGTDGTGTLALEDGRKLYHVKIIGAVRAVEDYSTNIVYELEDGTGLIEVKQWFDENDCEAISTTRAETQKEHIYLKVVGQIKDFDGKKMIVAESIRPLTTGNQLAHHMLEVVYSAESHKRRGTSMPSSGIGFGGPRPVSTGVPLAPSTASGGGGVKDTVLAYIREQGEYLEEGANVTECVTRLAGKYSEGEIRSAIEDLASEGHVYSTVDESHYKCA